MSEISLKNELTCKPLDTLEEVFSFVDNPPAWSSLCKELNPHSKYAIRNVEVIEKYAGINVKNFCHFNLTSEFDVKRQERSQLSKVLVCHDMANGYHDDRFVL